jgi:hypothetical protein
MSDNRVQGEREKMLTKADFATKLKSFLKNNFGLQPQENNLSTNTKSAAFELGPRPDFVWNLYVECRWEPWSKSSALLVLERDVVRVVVQFKGKFANLIGPVASTLSAAAGERFEIRVSNSEGTIYIVRSALRALDVSILPSQQKERSLRYGEECVAISKFWKESVTLLDEMVISKAKTMPTSP